MAFTITLQNVVNLASTHGDLLPLTGVGGFTNEPALSLCNDALSDLLADPNDWKFNRIEMPMMVTCPNRIDQLFAGACAFSLGSTSQGWGIDLASASAITVTAGVVTVTFLENHRFAVGDTIFLNNVAAKSGNLADPTKYNATFTDNGTLSQWTGGFVLTAVGAKTASFAAVAGQNNGDILGAPGITNFGYGTSVSLQEMNNTSSPVNVQPATIYRQLPVVSRIANPDKVAVLQDLGTGVLKLRYNFIPGSTTWGVNIVYQAQAPLKVALTDNWSPFPDNFAAVYRQALLYRMYRYLNDPKADNEFKKLQQEISKAQAGDDAEPTQVALEPDSLLDPSYWSYGGWW